MLTAPSPILTPRDLMVLEAMLAGPLVGQDLLAAATRKKLASAQIIFAEDLPDNVVTIGSRVALTVGDRWPQECRLVTSEHYVPGQDHQTLASLRGLGMLGLSAGTRLDLDYGTHHEVLEIQKVLYQPEAVSKSRGQGGRLRLVSSQGEARRICTDQFSISSTEDDPGPSAA